MSLPLLYSPPDTPEDWRGWAFNHAALHADVVNAVGAQRQITGLAQFQLYPLNQDDLGLWLYRHQEMHAQANAVLGIPSFDLLQLDLTDKQQLGLWLIQNGDEHQKWASMLGLG